MIVKSRLVLVLAIACGLALAAAILYAIPPEQNRFAPPCLFHQMTGLHCPGCGATRAVYALLHLHPEEAAKKNVLFVLALPFLVMGCARGVWAWMRGKAPPEPTFLNRPRNVLLVTGVIFAFAILRNLPWPPFTMLAPQ
jgi:hypothetical protein